MAEEKNKDIESSVESSEEMVSEEVVETAEETVKEETVEESAEKTAEPQRPKSANLKQQGDDDPHWYVVHTYSGYEDKVVRDIQNTIRSRHLEDQMFDVTVPVETVIEDVRDKNGNIVKNKKGIAEKKTKTRKKFPGYVLVHMIKNDVTWYVVRNSLGVTGFVGPGSEPVPLTDIELLKLGIKVEGLSIDVEPGDHVKVVAGEWENFEGVVKTVNNSKRTVIIPFEMSGGRLTDVEIDIDVIQKIEE